MNQPLFVMGPSIEAIREARESILAILSSPADQSNIQIALTAFQEAVAVKNNTITNCSFVGSSDSPKKPSKK
jgi:hypothetical protein